MWRTVCASLPDDAWCSQVSDCDVAALWPSGPPAWFLTHHSSALYRMWQPHAAKLRWVRARRSRLDGAGSWTPTWVITVVFKVSPVWLWAYLWGSNNSGAGNPAFLMPLPVCDERPLYGQTLIHPDKMSHVQASLKDKIPSVDLQRRSWTSGQITTRILLSVCTLHLNLPA